MARRKGIQQSFQSFKQMKFLWRCLWISLFISLISLLLLYFDTTLHHLDITLHFVDIMRIILSSPIYSALLTTFATLIAYISLRLAYRGHKNASSNHSITSHASSTDPAIQSMKLDQPMLIPTDQDREDTPTNTVQPTKSDQSTSDDSSKDIFFYNTPLPKPDEFFGRRRQKSDLRNRIRKGTSTSIIDPRRIGKTWFLRYLKLIAEAGEFGFPCHVGYLDATLPSCSTVVGFTKSALEALDSKNDIFKVADLGLEALQHEVRSRKERLILCIDEFDGFQNREGFNLDFFKSLRAMAQNGLVLIVASRQPLKDLISQEVNTERVFNFFQQFILGTFSVKEAREFARAKTVQAGFSRAERGKLLKYGCTREQEWPPLRMQLVGQMLLTDKDSDSYHPRSQKYWDNFEKRLEEEYKAAMG